jgi:hypothetical protein
MSSKQPGRPIMNCLTSWDRLEIKAAVREGHLEAHRPLYYGPLHPMESSWDIVRRKRTRI